MKRYAEITRETAANLRIIDDALFRLVAEKKDVCQEILRTLLDMPGLQVIKVEAQSIVQSLHREITLDALCIVNNKDYCNIEMQKGNSNDDIARTRFHASAITAKYTPKGTDFRDIPSVTILYITEYDSLGNGQTVTHVNRCMRIKNGYVPVYDGEDIVFANTAIKDGSDKSELLQLMLHKNSFDNAKFPAISSAIRYFKDTEGGRYEVCKTIETYAQGLILEAVEEARMDAIRNVMKNSLCSFEEAIRMLGIPAGEQEVYKRMYEDSLVC